MKNGARKRYGVAARLPGARPCAARRAGASGPRPCACAAPLRSHRPHSLAAPRAGQGAGMPRTNSGHRALTPAQAGGAVTAVSQTVCQQGRDDRVSSPLAAASPIQASLQLCSTSAPSACSAASGSPCRSSPA